MKVSMGGFKLNLECAIWNTDRVKLWLIHVSNELNHAGSNLWRILSLWQQSSPVQTPGISTCVQLYIVTHGSLIADYYCRLEICDLPGV